MRILLITEYSPFEESFGAQQRSRHLWRALSAVGEVDVALLRQADAVSVQAPSDSRFVVEAMYRLLPFGWRKYAQDLVLSRELARHVDLRAYDLG
jgi:hypothetical protein